MSVRTKTLLIVGLVLISLICLLYFVSDELLAGSYEALEIRESRQNMQRVLNATQSQLDQLKLVAIDWAHWDDTRDFILDPSPNHEFIRANMMDVTFVHQGFSYSAFINTDGEIVYEKMVDLTEAHAVAVPSDIYSHLRLDTPLMQHRDEAMSEITGVIALEDGIMFVVSVPVTNSEAQPPINGYMVWGRYLSETVVQEVSELTGFSVNIQPYHGTLPADMERVKPLLDDSAMPVQPLNDTTIAAYSVINDVYGQPALMVSVENTRDIMHLGKQNWNYFLISLTFLGVSSIIVTLMLLERVVLSRLARLNNSMVQVTSTGDMDVTIASTGRDELAQLGRTIRQMLATLAASRATLQEAHDTLDARVQERTVQLAEVNRKLLIEIAERKEAQEALAIARDQALEALRLKTEILANVSHDARTPLNIVTLNTEMLQRGRGGDLNERGKKMLDNILVNAHQLLNFHNNLLGEAQLGHNKAKLQRQPLDTAKLLDEVASLSQPLAERKGLAFHIKHDATLETLRAQTVGDADRLKQMMVNLVDNAVKFTDSGSITIAARLENEHTWALEVSDTGVGIPRAAQSRIFEAFYQVDGSVTRTANRGVGLGLSIVKQLANLMGATIEINSDIGQGTTFRILIPLEQVESVTRHDPQATVA